jgi:RNA polymerase sigma-70 factor (ECF subfamily)
MSDAAVGDPAKASGDLQFRQATEPYLHEIQLHCYRMLGSVHDAEDALQETLLRAWRHRGELRDPSAMRAWLYRIATNACLRMASRKRPEPAPVDFGVEVPVPNAGGVVVAPVTPYPDRLIADTRDEPAGRYDQRESVELAFLAAIQLLPPRQRAVLILRDVLGMRAAEVAALVDASVPSVNSALQRARATLADRRRSGDLSPTVVPRSEAGERDLVGRFMRAWEAVDVPGLVALLRDDALLTMPPTPLGYRGRAAIAEFFATVPEGGRLDRIRLVETRANRQPALAAYAEGAAYGVMVLALDGGQVASVTGYGDPSLHRLFGLPERI